MKTNPEHLIHSFSDSDTYNVNGLTKREYFAAVALQGILANPESYSSAPTQIAKYAVDQADLLIDELNKETN